jgi:2-haloacid dehalogenase
VYGFDPEDRDMFISRREFLAVAAGSAAAATAPTIPRVRAVAFDALAIFDPRPVFALADQTFPGVGLSDEWRTRQFEYCWLRVCSGHYEDFWKVTADSLSFATRKLRLDISTASRDRLLNGFLELRAWPDVVPVLESMRKAGLRLALLSNFTPAMLEANVKSAGLDRLFEAKVSTDFAQTYKPDPRAYQLGVTTLNLAREEILFVAFAGWDAAGASQFGYPTYWANRQRLPPEELGVQADASGDTLRELTTLVT